MRRRRRPRMSRRRCPRRGKQWCPSAPGGRDSGAPGGGDSGAPGPGGSGSRGLRFGGTRVGADGEIPGVNPREDVVTLEQQMPPALENEVEGHPSKRRSNSSPFPERVVPHYAVPEGLPCREEPQHSVEGVGARSRPRGDPMNRRRKARDSTFGESCPLAVQFGRERGRWARSAADVGCAPIDGVFVRGEPSKIKSSSLL